MTLNLTWAAGAVWLVGTSLLAATPAAAQPRGAASFDCRQATTVTEREICASPRLTALDRQIGIRFADLRREMDAASAKALVADQRDFLAARDSTGEPNAPTSLPDALRHRLSFLSAVTTGRTGLIGTWRKLGATLEVTRTRAGTLRYWLIAVDPIAVRWTCEMTGSLTGGGPMRWSGGIEDSPGQAIGLQRQRHSLTVTEPASDRGYCGLNGGIAGTYFPVAR